MSVVADLTDDYIAKMEDVLEVYERPYDPLQPLICVDEKPVTCMPTCGRPRRPCQDGRHGGITNMSVVGRPKSSALWNPKRAVISPLPRRIVRGLSSLRLP